MEIDFAHVHSEPFARAVLHSNLTINVHDKSKLREIIQSRSTHTKIIGDRLKDRTHCKL
jgi:hypothetical protein